MSRRRQARRRRQQRAWIKHGHRATGYNLVSFSCTLASSGTLAAAATVEPRAILLASSGELVIDAIRAPFALIAWRPAANTRRSDLEVSWTYFPTRAEAEAAAVPLDNVLKYDIVDVTVKPWHRRITVTDEAILKMRGEAVAGRRARLRVGQRRKAGRDDAD